MYAAIFIEVIVFGGLLFAWMFRSILREDEVGNTVFSDTPVTYTCPMHLDIHSPKPGKCPKCITMALVDERTLTKRTGASPRVSRLDTFRPLIIIFFVLFVLAYNGTLVYLYSFGNNSADLTSATGPNSIMAGMAMSGVSSTQTASPTFFSYNSLMVFNMIFMAGFFLIFGGLKLFNLKAFATRFATYDIIARRWKLYGYLYPFIEIALGIAFLFSIAPRFISIFAATILLIGAVGIWRKIHTPHHNLTCACLGTKFDIPLTRVTFFENIVMAGMALFMLV